MALFRVNRVERGADGTGWWIKDTKGNLWYDEGGRWKPAHAHPAQMDDFRGGPHTTPKMDQYPYHHPAWLIWWTQPWKPPKARDAKADQKQREFMEKERKRFQSVDPKNISIHPEDQAWMAREGRGA